jgi:hypothetical protein
MKCRVTTAWYSRQCVHGNRWSTALFWQQCLAVEHRDVCRRSIAPTWTQQLSRKFIWRQKRLHETVVFKPNSAPSQGVSARRSPSPRFHTLNGSDSDTATVTWWQWHGDSDTVTVTWWQWHRLVPRCACVSRSTMWRHAIWTHQIS